MNNFICAGFGKRMIEDEEYTIINGMAYSLLYLSKHKTLEEVLEMMGAKVLVTA